MDSNLSRILIIDDAAVNIEMISSILGEEYELLFALSGREGLELAFNTNPDLILLDLIMPGMSGFEVCEHLKQESRTARIPVIFITASDDKEDESKGLELGAIDFITKPFRPAILKARLKNHLDLKKYRDLLEQLTVLDGLTGIANRRKFDQFLSQEWSRAQREKSQISILLIDIDHFKKFNDHYGHLKGDDCLKQVAQAIAGNTKRPADLCARYGGEEFAVVLSTTNAAGAKTFANVLIEIVHGLHIPHTDSPVSSCVTVSIGSYTASPWTGITIHKEQFIENADGQLYHAKNSGRNQLSQSWEL